jgi:hypothetical protein
MTTSRPTSVPGDGFDRIRRREPQRAPGDSLVGERARDPLGRRALFSVAEQSPSLGAVTLECSACQRTSVVTPRQAVWLALPSLHLPIVKRSHSSWMRCPACRRRTWLSLRIKL